MLNILLPIETINRELDFRIVLASMLSGNNYKIYIGQHDFLMSLLPKMERGLYIGKNIFHRRSDTEKGERYYALKKHGFDIIFLHEEGAVFPGDEGLWEELITGQYNLNFFDKDDRICVWGNFQAKVDNNRSEGLEICVTGHPRFDLYKDKWNSYFKMDVEKIQAEHGKYVLINGNYGTSNHGIGLDYIFSDAGDYKVDNVESRLQRVGFYSYSTKQMVSIVELTHHLAVKYPDINFIYRPHPSENQDYYKIIFGGVSNIRVNHEGPIGAWILGAKAVIHDGCTTAIEATLAGIPVINFKPLYDEKFDIWLPNQLGRRAESVEEVFDLLNNINDSDFNFRDKAAFERVKSLFYNFGGDSFERLIEIVNSKAEEKVSEPSKNISFSFINNKYILMRLKQEAAKISSSKAAKESQYHKRKFYGFDKAIISAKFEQAKLVLGKNITYKMHNPYLIEVK
jgi:surface carbohydrate biosynthesis protein